MRRLGMESSSVVKVVVAGAPNTHGYKCSECGQFVKLYRRKMNSIMARALIIAYQRRPAWVRLGEHMVRRWGTGSGDYAKLRHWGFIEQMPKDPEVTVTRTSTYWKITEDGVKFVEGGLAHSHVLLYNDTCYGFDSGQITIVDALGKHFNYVELMEEV